MAVQPGVNDGAHF